MNAYVSVSVFDKLTETEIKLHKTHNCYDEVSVSQLSISMLIEILHSIKPESVSFAVMWFGLTDDIIGLLNMFIDEHKCEAVSGILSQIPGMEKSTHEPFLSYLYRYFEKKYNLIITIQVFT